MTRTKPTALVEGNSKGEFWNTPRTEYGIFHEPTLPLHNPNVLFVYIHGILGNCIGTWQAGGESSLPECALRQSDIDVAALSFQYAAFPWQRGGIVEAADELRTLLHSQQFDSFKHIVFITHSTGGLVLKELLCNELTDALAAIEQGDSDLQEIRSIALRTRNIINVTVPHIGAGRVPTYTALITHEILSVIALPILWSVRMLSGGRLNWGYNRIAWQLHFRNKWLKRLEDDYNEGLRAFRQADLPCAISSDVLAQGDVAIANQFMHVDGAEIGLHEDKELIRYRGTHGDVKKPNGPKRALLTALIGAIQGHYRATADFAVAHHTMLRAFNLDRRSNVSILATKGFADTPEGKQDSVRTMRIAPQGIVLESLLETIRKATTEESRCVIVTGDAGVGKSVVLRRLARKLSTRFLVDPSASPFPVIVPLQQLKLSESRIAQFSGIRGTHRPWEVLRNLWCKRIRRFLYDEVPSASVKQRLTDVGMITIEWMENRLQALPTVFIFDGVDEFIANHHGITVPDIRVLLEQMLSRGEHNSRLLIILGVRRSLAGLEGLVPGPRITLEVSRLTMEEAVRLFPSAETVLRRVKDERLQRLLLTPLILNNLGPAISDLDAENIVTRSHILRAALFAIVQRMIATWNGRTVPAEAWLDALTVLMFLFFVNQWTEISMQTLRRELSATIQRWEEHLQKTQGQDSAYLRQGLELLLDDKALLEILSRTVFLPTGLSTYRPSHWEWEQYLSGRYLAYCVRYKYPDDFGHRALNSDVFRSTGEQVRETDVSGSLLETFANRSRMLHNDYILGNLVNMLATSRAPLTGDLVKSQILGKFQELSPLVRHVILSGLCTRSLSDPGADIWVENFRQPVIEAATYYASSSSGANPLTRSLAWCFLKAFASRGWVSAPVERWPGLLMNNESREILSLICTPKEDTFVSTEKQRSVQAAFLWIQKFVLEYPNQCISAAHYLYPLTIGYKMYAPLDFEVIKGLPSVLEDARLAAAYEGFTDVPEVRGIWQYCRKLMNKSELSPSSAKA